LANGAELLASVGSEHLKSCFDVFLHDYFSTAPVAVRRTRYHIREHPLKSVSSRTGISPRLRRRCQSLPSLVRGPGGGQHGRSGHLHAGTRLGAPARVFMRSLMTGMVVGHWCEIEPVIDRSWVVRPRRRRALAHATGSESS
jgi:hypothetical protein